MSNRLAPLTVAGWRVLNGTDLMKPVFVIATVGAIFLALAGTTAMNPRSAHAA
jgi:hypothetical protein